MKKNVFYCWSIGLSLISFVFLILRLDSEVWAENGNGRLNRQSSLATQKQVVADHPGILLPLKPVLPLQSRGPEIGMWVWEFNCYADEQQRNRLLDFCKKEQISRLLVQIHYQADAAAKRLTIRAPEALAILVQRAAQSGIKVEALDGDSQWALASRQATFWPKLEAILAWNDQQPFETRLAGIHLDVEPYLLKEFKTEEKTKVMEQYLGFLTQVRRRLSDHDAFLSLAADIPFWYDSSAKNEAGNYFIKFNGKNHPLSSHVQDICDYVVVMSYRRKATGNNSITALSGGELDYAEKIRKKIFVAVEMSRVKDSPSISFFGTEPSLFREQFNGVMQAFKKRKGFGGIMIHQYKSFETYLESSGSNKGSR